jgi:hypothetical protein
MRPVRRALAIVVGVAALSAADGFALADGTTAPATTVAWHRDKKDPRWVQGTVTVDSPPDVVWARIQRVDAWPSLLSDVNRMRVTEHKDKDSHWKIELETKTLPYGMLGYDVDTSGPGRTGKLYTDRLGVKVVAQTDILPGPTPSQSVIVYSFFIEVSGIPKMLISEQELHKKQEHMVAVTLDDFEKNFKPRPAAAAQ